MIPEVSAVVPTKDRWPLLERALRSVLAQDGVVVEAIVVDDGSTDGTRERLEAWGDPRVRYLRHERSEGVSRARNRGTEAARAPYVAFLDDDDVWAPDHLNRLLSALPPGGSFAFARHYVVDLEREDPQPRRRPGPLRASTSSSSRATPWSLRRPCWRGARRSRPPAASIRTSPSPPTGTCGSASGSRGPWACRAP